MCTGDLRNWAKGAPSLFPPVANAWSIQGGTFPSGSGATGLPGPSLLVASPGSGERGVHMGRCDCVGLPLAPMAILPGPNEKRRSWAICAPGPAARGSDRGSAARDSRGVRLTPR